MNLNQWAIKWGIRFEAVEDLRQEFGLTSTEPTPASGVSETAIQTQIRLEASKKGGRLWRNNVGATYTNDDRFIRYGLANDSKSMNDMIKSSDLIGIKPIHILPNMVGWTIGQFVAREVKPSDWQYSGKKREQAQLKFLELVAGKGGDACFAKSEGTL